MGQLGIALHSRVALVTGASRGIGKCIAVTLGSAGATVIGTATTPDGAASITRYLEAAGVSGRGARLDVTDPDNVSAVVKELAADDLQPLILVNNAGITRDNLLLRMKDSEWQQIMDTNLSSVFRLSRTCLKGMMKARYGRIINIGSVVGSMGNPGQANYAAAKAGIIGFSKALAQEVGSRGITVNTVAPGFVQTDMTAALTDGQRADLEAKIPLGRLGEPADIAGCVAFLASDLGAYISGETIHVNGGMYMT